METALRDRPVAPAEMVAIGAEDGQSIFALAAFLETVERLARVMVRHARHAVADRDVLGRQVAVVWAAVVAAIGPAALGQVGEDGPGLLGLPGSGRLSAHSRNQSSASLNWLRSTECPPA